MLNLAVRTVTTGLFIVRVADYFHLEDGDITLLRNVVKYVPVYTVSSTYC
jgi:hypothetical protein